jgi:hypothetical protein
VKPLLTVPLPAARVSFAAPCRNLISHARNGALNRYYNEFNPTQYDPDAWLKLAREAGRGYAVFADPRVIASEPFAAPRSKSSYAIGCAARGAQLSRRVRPAEAAGRLHRAMARPGTAQRGGARIANGRFATGSAPGHVLK